MKWIMLLAAVWPLWAQAADPASSSQPRVLVRLETVQQRNLERRITAYGKVSPDPDAVSAVNAGHEVIVSRLWVTPGEKVDQGQKLATLQTAPSARMAYQRARTEGQFAREDLARKRRLLKRQLATRADVAAAEKALKDAESALKAQRELGNDTTETVVTAPFPGIVTSIDVNPGQRLQPGGAVLSVTRRDRLIVRLGVEPEEAPSVSAGARVRLSPVFGDGPSLNAAVDQVQGIVDAQTRLVDVLVRLNGAQTNHLLPGMQLRGRITVAGANTLAVPRRSVLKDSQGSYVFVVNGETAHRINVRTGIRTERWIGVSADRLRSGDRVVVQGNYELTDGAAVREGGS